MLTARLLLPLIGSAGEVKDGSTIDLDVSANGDQLSISVQAPVEHVSEDGTYCDI